MVLQKLSSKPFRSDEPLEGHPLPPFQAHFLKPINGLEDAAVNSDFEPTWYHHVSPRYIYANWPATAELSPPDSDLPQVTTDPSARIAANAS